MSCFKGCCITEEGKVPHFYGIEGRGNRDTANCGAEYEVEGSIGIMMGSKHNNKQENRRRIRPVTMFSASWDAFFLLVLDKDGNSPGKS